MDFKLPLQFRTGENIDFKRLRVFGCSAQIFIKENERGNGKISSRSEKGTFIGMSKLGNGFVICVERTKQFVEIDSADVKFNETFSDCRDRKGKIIKGGRVLDPDLFNVEEMEATIELQSQKAAHDKGSRFAGRNRFSNLTSMDEIESDNESNGSNASNESDENNARNESMDNDETRKEIENDAIDNGKRCFGNNEKIGSKNRN